MVASSVSTYLDVMQAAKGATGVAPDTIDSDPEFTARAAQVLAAIQAGTQVVTELPEKTGLDTAQILATLAWLSQAGLIELNDQDGSLRAQLTKPAQAALSGTND